LVFDINLQDDIQCSKAIAQCGDAGGIDTHGIALSSGIPAAAAAF
jgi:hypothetical protein